MSAVSRPRALVLAAVVLAVAGCKPLTLNAPGPAAGGKIRAAAQSVLSSIAATFRGDFSRGTRVR